MKIFTIHQAKTNLSKLVEKACEGEEIIIARGSLPVRLGKLSSAEGLASDLAAALTRERFEPLAISADHGIRAGFLPGPHKNPFDRMLIAQSLADNLPLVSCETIFDSYSVRRLW